MPNHERNGRLFLLGKCEELRRELAQHGTVKGQIAQDPKAIENREEQQRVLDRFSDCLSLFDQQMCPFYRRLWFPARNILWYASGRLRARPEACSVPGAMRAC